MIILDIESGKKIPNSNIINSISKALAINIDAIEPDYFSDYFEDEKEPSPQPAAAKNTYVPRSNQVEKATPKDNTFSDAFNKAIRKIPVLSKITIGKKVPFENDISDYKFEPIFQGKSNNVVGDQFIYYTISDNSLSGSRILKGDLALIFLTDSVMDKDMIVFIHNNRLHIRRIKLIDSRSVILYPDNPEYEALITDKKDIQIVGKVVRIEFKI
jgi:SOS-response transcriptional repressor LexA